MIDNKAQPGAEDAGDPAEDAAWESLRAELGDEGEADEGGSGRATAEEAGADESDSGEREAEAEKRTEAKLSYEELEKRYRQSSGAIKEERALRKQHAEEARKAREQAEAITKMIAEFRSGKQQGQPQEQAPQAPSLEEDPIGFFQHQIAELKSALGERDKRLEDISASHKQTSESIQTDQRARALHSFTQQSEIDFRRQSPDYDDACTYLANQRMAELSAWYPDHSPKAQAIAEQYGYEDVAAFRQSILRNDSIQVAQQAVQMGISPAQMYYETAKNRGYQANAGAGGNGKSADAAIESARRGVKASRSLSGGEGRTDNAMSAADLADLYETDPEAADKMFEKMARQGLLG